MWQLLQAFWGKIAGQAPPAPPAARTDKAPQTPPGKMPLQPGSPRPAEASQPTPEPSTPAVGEIASQEKSPDSEAVESPLGTSTAKSIGSFWAMADTGSRVSRIASATDSGRAVSAIATARLRQPE